jgi:threonine dehydrogenase-like Zn-dependent dehydrogenase
VARSAVLSPGSAVGFQGPKVTLIDTNPERAAIAGGLGVRFTQGDEALRNCDAVFHASSTSEGFSLVLSLAGFEAEVIELSWYGDSSVMVPLGDAFHSRRLSLRSSQVGAASPSRRARWSHVRRLGLALSLASNPRLDSLVQEATSFDALPQSRPGLLRFNSGLFHRVIY